jgi:antirestriction protein ArdC
MRILLMMEMVANGWTDTRFMTYKQVQSLAQEMKKAGTPDADLPHVKKGAKSITIYKVGRQEIKRDKLDSSGKPVLDESGKPVKETSLGKVFLQTYRIFNADNIANLAPLPQPQSTPSFEVHGQIEELVKKLGVAVRYEPQASAYYEPMADRITVPERSQYQDTVKDGKVVFSGAAKHYSVLLHECCHGTGHESRLSRLMTGARGTDSYSREELISETASTYLMAELGLESDEVIKQHASYLDHWAKMIRDDPKALFQAMSAAEKAADWFMQRHEKQLAAAPVVSQAPGITVGVGVQAPAVAAMTATATLTSQVSALGTTPLVAPGGFGVVDRLPASGTPTVRVNGLRPIADVVSGVMGPGGMG